MKVLFLSNIPSPYQIDFINEINHYCEFNGCFLYQTEKNRNWKNDFSGNKKIKILNYQNKFCDYINYYKYLLKEKPDIVIIGGYKLPLALFSLLYTKIFSKKSIFWLERPTLIHNKYKEKLKKIYLHNILSRATAVFAIGNASLEYYKIFNHKIFNIPYSLNLQAYYAINRKPLTKHDTIHFLFSGQFIHRKNILNLVNAFKNINVENIELNLIGSGELNEELSYIIKNDSRINILGFMQPEELPSIYAKNDIFILPSIHDGWALVINEAMAAEMAIISSQNVGASIEFIQHKDNGYFCDIDPSSIEDAINYYIYSREFIRIQAKKNRKIIKNSLGDCENSAREVFQVLKKLQ